MVETREDFEKTLDKAVEKALKNLEKELEKEYPTLKGNWGLFPSGEYRSLTAVMYKDRKADFKNILKAMVRWSITIESEEKGPINWKL